MKRPLLIGALVAALGAIGIVWFLDRYEYVESSVFVGYQGEARFDPLLAAERFLRELGYTVVPVQTLADLAQLPQHGAMVVGTPRWALPLRAQQTVLDWVRRGNVLIVETQAAGLSDPLADALGIERHFNGRAGSPSPVPHGGKPELPAEVSGEAYTLPWAADHSYRISLVHYQTITLAQRAPQFAFGGEQGSYVLGFRFGEGQVVAFNNFLPLVNWSLGNVDNAPFLARLAARAGADSKILFLRSPAKASLWAWLTAHAAGAMAGAALLLALWLWRTAVRSGPVAPDAPPARLRWVDHITASGRFLWRSGGEGLLAARAREAAFTSVERRVPGFGGLAPTSKKTVLVRQFGLSPEEAGQLLGMLPGGPGAIVAEARLLRRIHELSSRPSSPAASVR